MVKLSGILEYSMGGFLCLRGFASFKLLSAISEPNPEVQRKLIEDHKGEMARFLSDGEYRFFPEIILSLNLTGGANKDDFDIVEQFHTNLRSGKTWNKSIGGIQFSISQNITNNELNKYDPVPRVDRINITHIKFNETQHKLVRIDGNHRLSAADEIRDEFVVPYCLLLFRYPSENEQFSRAIFYNINAKQIPLNLEENLKVILNSPEVFPDSKLITDQTFGWKFYLARKTIESLDFTYFPAISAYISASKYSFFVDLYGFLIKNGNVEENDSAVEKVKSQLVEVEKSLTESAIVSTTTNIAIIGALAYYRLTDDFKYRGFLSWIKKNNIGSIGNLHIEDVINLYNEIHEHIPKRIFLARWYPAENDPEYSKSVHRVNAIKEVAKELNLNLTDLGTRDTGTFDIREVMYRDIRKRSITTRIEKEGEN